MGLLIVCFCEERKQFGTEDMGPTSTPSLLFYISFYRTKVNTKQIAMQRKQVIQKTLKNIKKNKLWVISINKHKMGPPRRYTLLFPGFGRSRYITKHCLINAMHSNHISWFGFFPCFKVVNLVARKKLHSAPRCPREPKVRRSGRALVGSACVSFRPDKVHPDLHLYARMESPSHDAVAPGTSWLISFTGTLSHQTDDASKWLTCLERR